ncbi:MAG TPA: hypothetical protein VK578_10410 [Edaphobacter sp.]|nr:hypothetical protein [Edaphobacter sp.]
MKGYLVRWKIRDGDDQTIDYWFSSSPRDGATWPTRESAEVHMQEFNRKGVTIPSSFGERLTIHDFKVEEREDGKFVVFYEAPVILREP